MGWQVLVAPKGTPDPVVGQLAADLRKLLETPDLRSRLERIGMPFRPLFSAEPVRFIEGEQKLRWPRRRWYAARKHTVSELSHSWNPLRSTPGSHSRDRVVRRTGRVGSMRGAQRRLFRAHPRRSRRLPPQEHSPRLGWRSVGENPQGLPRGDRPISREPCWARTPHGFLGAGRRTSVRKAKMPRPQTNASCD